jgi:hypothetical protein
MACFGIGLAQTMKKAAIAGGLLCFILLWDRCGTAEAVPFRVASTSPIGS